MRIFSVYIFAILLTGNSYAQSWIGSNMLDGSGNIEFIQSRMDHQKNLYLLGTFEGIISPGNDMEVASYNSRDYFVCKYDSTAKPVWINHFGSIHDEPSSGGLALSKDGNPIIAGHFIGDIIVNDQDTIASSGLNDLILISFSSEGSINWIKQAGYGGSDQLATCLTSDNQGHMLLAGVFKDSIVFPDDYTVYAEEPGMTLFFSKLSDISGDLLWVKKFETLDSYSNCLISDVVAGEDHYFLTGSFDNSVVVGQDTIHALNSTMDLFIVMTDTSGNRIWTRKVFGEGDETIARIISDPEQNVFVAGQYNSSSLLLDSTATDTVRFRGSKGGFDFFLVKYDRDGKMKWINSFGGKGDETVSDIELAGNTLFLGGAFSDSLYWGDTVLASAGIDDTDMLIGKISTSGIPTGARTLSGSTGSDESASSYHYYSEVSSYAVIRSNASLLRLENETYSSPGNTYYLAIGIIGCRPISIDNIFLSDVATCFGDSTGSIAFAVTGGFGEPYGYSIDNGISYQINDPFFEGLPAGSFDVAINDRANCVHVGPEITLDQPDQLTLEIISTSDISEDFDGSIVVAAYGGTPPYRFTLLPPGNTRGFGTFTIGPGEEGTYLVEVDDANMCGPVRTDSIEIKSTKTGFSAFQQSGQRVYPNPASGMITLEVPTGQSECTIELMSLTGQVVMSRNAFPAGGILKEPIDVSSLSKGMYMLRVDGKTLRKGIVIQ